MTSLRFYGGVNEIGGNKILLESKDTRLWFDFGQSFTSGQKYYVNWLQPRRKSGLKDYFEFDMLPKIDGLYSEEALEGTGHPYSEAGFQGVFITHAHFDHVNHISFLDEGIPIFTGKGTKLFMEAMETTSVYANYGDRDYRGFRTGDIVNIDGIEIEPIHVDHSIPAAYGYIVRTGDKTIVYTGDLRTHGPRADMTEEFLESAITAEPDVMICEGTRMARRGKRKHLTEAGVGRGVKEVCREADNDGKMVLYTHPGRDMDRLRTFHNAAEACGRVMVITPKTAHLLHRLIEDQHLDLPDPMTDDLVRVFYKKKRSGTYSEKDYYIWERAYLDRLVTAQEINSKPTEYLVSLDFFSFAELIDIRPEEGSHFIYSMSEPFTEEDLEDEVLHN
ncbi:MAG: MBL fold metallo-hydrolase, partial [Candidatus Bathyarchaeota archaeon]|nr:MBL fold metallo-hydrolase [Candidatus Bathyarchaeota archaeon]